jgi:hypothetical protein
VDGRGVLGLAGLALLLVGAGYALARLLRKGMGAAERSLMVALAFSCAIGIVIALRFLGVIGSSYAAFAVVLGAWVVVEVALRRNAKEEESGRRASS